jgi:hypothetical protein
LSGLGRQQPLPTLDQELGDLCGQGKAAEGVRALKHQASGGRQRYIGDVTAAEIRGNLDCCGRGVAAFQQQRI